jgi:class 3 adenylate cyclase/CheY-like chemotaxis protein
MKQTLFVVDDTQFNIDLIEATLSDTYIVKSSLDGESALLAIEAQHPDLILLDIMMPGMDGYEVCKQLKNNLKTKDIPVIFLTAKSDVDDETRGFDLGAVDYISKPLSIPILMARIKTHLAFHTAVRQLAELNQTLEMRVSDGVARIERLDQLRRFFSPAIVDLLLTDKADEYLRARRREIVVVFLDLRGYTAFTETHGPDAVMRALNEFHIAMGKIIMAYDGTVERFTGDGMMIFFNDPIEIANPAERAVKMAIDMQKRMIQIDDEWQQRGHDMKMGIGITQGYATLGAIGFEGRRDYTAIGSVVNLAARLCGQAAGGEILCDEVVEGHIRGQISVSMIPELMLKGYAKPVKTFKIN